MKTLLTIVAVLAFSALLLSPVGPKSYPNKIVLDERSEIVLKENHIENTISKIEQSLAIDSLHIKSIKEKKYE